MVRTCHRTHARGLKSARGASFIELVAAMAIMVGATMAVGTVSNIVSNMSVQRRIALRMASLGKSVQDVVRFGSSCQTALRDPANSGFRLPTLGTNIITGISSDFDASGSHAIFLYVPGIRSGPNRDQNYIGDPSLTQVSSGGWDQLIDQELQILKLQMTRTTRIPGTYKDGQSDFIATLKMRVNGRRVSGGSGGVEGARDIILGTIVFRASDGAAATSAGEILRCGGTQSVGPQDFCENLGCSWDAGATPNCDCGSVDIGCEPGEILVGFDSSSGVICKPLGGECAPNQIIVGADIDQAICAQAPSCTAGIGALSWYGVGAEANNFCFNTAVVGPVASGQTIIVSSANASAPQTGDGSAVFECRGGLWGPPDLTTGSCAAAAPTATPTSTPTPSGGATATPTPSINPACLPNAAHFAVANPCSGGLPSTYYLDGTTVYTDASCTLLMTGFIGSDAFMANWSEYINGTFNVSGTCPTPTPGPPTDTPTPTPSPTSAVPAGCPGTGIDIAAANATYCPNFTYGSTIAPCLGSVYCANGYNYWVSSNWPSVATATTDIMSKPAGPGCGCFGPTFTPTPTPTSTPTPTDTPTPTPTPPGPCTSYTGAVFYKPANPCDATPGGSIPGGLYSNTSQLFTDASCTALVSDGYYSPDPVTQFSWIRAVSGVQVDSDVCPNLCTDCTYSVSSPVGCLPWKVGDNLGAAGSVFRCTPALDYPGGCSPDLPISATCPAFLQYCSISNQACLVDSDCPGVETCNL